MASSTRPGHRRLTMFLAVVFCVVTGVDSAMRERTSQNMWSGWSDWSTCSLTCGQGTRMRRRDCVGKVADKLVRREAPHCRGRGVEHYLCQMAVCAPSDKDPRAYQCTLRDDQPVQGKTYEWAPYSGGTHQCDLNCMAVGFNFYYNFGKLLDGTPCQPATSSGDSSATINVCVNGNCAVAGCDGRIGSNAAYDKCHVCGGRNVTCLHYKAAYLVTTPATGYGYTKIATIPKGACHVTFKDNSTNYLSLQDTRGNYIVNGHWRISHTGNYSAGGVQFVYDREGTTETLRAVGPLKEKVTLVLMFRQQNPGVYFEYYITRNQTMNETSAANITITPLRRHIRHRYSGAPRRNLQNSRLHRGRPPTRRDKSRTTRRNGKTVDPANPPYPGTPRGRSRAGYPVPLRGGAGLRTTPDGNVQHRQQRPQESPSNYRNPPNTHPPIERGTDEREHSGSRGGTYTNRRATSESQRNYASPVSPRIPNRYGRLPNDPRTKGVRVYVLGGDHPSSRERFPPPGPHRPAFYPRQKRLYNGDGRAYVRADDRRGIVPSSGATRADMSTNQAYWSQFNSAGNDAHKELDPIRAYPTRDRWENADTRENRPVDWYGKPSQAGDSYDRRDRKTYPAVNRPDGRDVTPADTVQPLPPRTSYTRTQRPTIRPPFALPPYAGPRSSWSHTQRPRSSQQSMPRTHPKVPVTPQPQSTQTTVPQYPTRPVASWTYPQRQYPTQSPASSPHQATLSPTKRDRTTPLQPTSQSTGGAKGGAYGRRRNNSGKAWRKKKKSRTNATWKRSRTQSRPGYCGPCKKVTARLKNYCRSDFVVRAYIVDFEYIGNETRYEMRIGQSYKNTLALFNQEFVWAPDRCHCPRLKIDGEYIVMGTLVSDTITRESRLQISRSTFVRKFNRTNHRRLTKLQSRSTTKLNCKQFT